MINLGEPLFFSLANLGWIENFPEQILSDDLTDTYDDLLWYYLQESVWSTNRRLLLND